MVVHSLSLIASPDDAAVPGDERDTARYPILEIVSGDVCDAPEQEHFSVVVVTDRADNPLERIAEMSFICPVLFITSAVSVMARLAAARAGVAAILTRPTDVSELAEWLNDLVGSHRESPLSVLIVDDDQILAEAYTWTVEDEGIRAIVETDPLAVLGLIGTFDLDLVLLDMGMPNVNGIELAKMIHQSRRHLSLPIVFLSGERELGRQLEARTLGGDDFISKPVAPAHLVSLVRMRADRAIRLRSMMERDSLTGLLNHGRFMDRLHHELERCRRSRGEVSLALIEIDSFKGVNDTHGHVAGDQVLRTLAQTLTVGFRRIDIVGRLGGEEFGVLLLDTPQQAACVVVDRIRQRFSGIQFGATKNPFFVTFSAGISASRTQLDSKEIVSAADAHMYRAKAAGRNRVLGRITASG